MVFAFAIENNNNIWTGAKICYFTQRYFNPAGNIRPQTSIVKQGAHVTYNLHMSRCGVAIILYKGEVQKTADYGGYNIKLKTTASSIRVLVNAKTVGCLANITIRFTIASAYRFVAGVGAGKVRRNSGWVNAAALTF